jgi:hypothetical protein
LARVIAPSLSYDAVLQAATADYVAVCSNLKANGKRGVAVVSAHVMIDHQLSHHELAYAGSAIFVLAKAISEAHL